MEDIGVEDGKKKGRVLGKDILYMEGLSLMQASARQVRCKQANSDTSILTHRLMRGSRGGPLET